MQTYLDSLVADGAAGVLLHLRSSDQTWIGSSGRSELGSDRPVDPEGWFRVGSVTKTFTAVVVLQLVAEGKLRLDEPVGQWVPGVPDAISLRQLLNHTSGLCNYTDDLPADLNRFYAAVLGGELLAEPELQEMLTAVPVDDSYGYALGIERRRLPDGRIVWGHTGGIFGYLTLSYHAADLSRQLTLSYTGTTMNTPETGQVLAGLLT